MSMFAVILGIALGIIMWRGYHSIFHVVYFGGIKSIAKEFIGFVVGGIFIIAIIYELLGIPLNGDNNNKSENSISTQNEDQIKPDKQVERSQEKKSSDKEKQGNIVDKKEEPIVKQSNYSNITYKKYYNTRYKFDINYPTFLIEQEEPQNNDGRIFKSYDNEVILTVSGINNVTGITVEQEYNEIISNLSNIGYKSIGERSYIISWKQGGKVYYICRVFGKGSINEFTIVYQEGEAAIFNGIIDELYDSFTPGDLSVSH